MRCEGVLFLADYFRFAIRRASFSIPINFLVCITQMKKSQQIDYFFFNNNKIKVPQLCVYVICRTCINLAINVPTFFSRTFTSAALKLPIRRTNCDRYV